MTYHVRQFLTYNVQFWGVILDPPTYPKIWRHWWTFPKTFLTFSALKSFSFQIAKLALYKEFEAAKAAKEEAIEKSELLEQQSRTLREKLAIALEKKNKCEAKEFNQRKNIDMATSDLKVTKRELKDKQNYLNQLSDQLMLRQSDISDYQAQIQVNIRYLWKTLTLQQLLLP